MSNQPFINVPKAIFNLKISIAAKYIYELMLDRYKLSVVNDWSDDNNQYYIYYTIKELQKATGIGNKKVCKLLQELEENNLIIKKRQGQGKPSKIYLQDIENIQKSSKEHIKLDEKNNKKDISKSDEKNKKCKKDVSRNIEKTFKKASKEHNNKNNEIKNKKINDNIDDETQNSEILKITDAFKRFFGREPDKSFKKTIQKRLKENNLKIETIKAIEKAFKIKAKKPEAFVLYLTQFQNIEQENIQEQNQNSEADKPLEEWEVEWLLEIMEDDKNNGKPYSQEKIDEYKKLLDEFSKQRIEKQVTDMLDNSWI